MTHNEMNIDAGNRLDKVHEKLCGLMLEIYSNTEGDLKSRIIDDHKFWNKYVNHNLKIFDEFYKGGSERNLFVKIRYAELIEARICDLKKMCEQFMIEVNYE